MDYEKLYNYLIQSRREIRPVPQYKNDRTSGFHVHHITPVALGGGGESSNLVLLSKREHYLAHLIYALGIGKDDNRCQKSAYFIYYMQCKAEGLVGPATVPIAQRLYAQSTSLSTREKWITGGEEYKLHMRLHRELNMLMYPEKYRHGPEIRSRISKSQTGNQHGKGYSASLSPEEHERWTNNMKAGLAIHNKKYFGELYRPFLHPNKGIDYELWLIADEIYEVLEEGIHGFNTVLKHLFIDPKKHKYKTYETIVKWVRANGDPRMDEKWVEFVNGRLQSNSRASVVKDMGQDDTEPEGIVPIGINLSQVDEASSQQ